MQNKMNFYKLDNGLQLYFYPDKTKHSVMVNLIVKFGGVYSEVKIGNQNYHFTDGIAHLLEHYTIEQSEYGIVIKELTDRFMKANGYTDRNRTVYFFDAVKYVDEGLKLLLKGIHSPIFTEERLDFTKNAIREEIRADQDSCNRRMKKMEMEQLFHAYPYRSTIGTIEQLDHITLEELKRVFDVFYQPANEVIVVAGNFDEKEMLEKIKKIYEELQFTLYPVKKLKLDEPKEIVKKEATLYFPTARSIYELSFKVPIMNFTLEEKVKLEWYFTIFLDMNFSILSKVNQQLKESKVIDYGISYDFSFFENYLLLHIGAYTDKNIDEYILKKRKFKQAILKQLRNPVFDEEVYHLSMNENKMYVSLRPEHIQNLIQPFIENLSVFDYPYLDDVTFLESFSFEEYLKIIDMLDFSNYAETNVLDIKE